MFTNHYQLQHKQFYITHSGTSSLLLLSYQRQLILSLHRKDILNQKKKGGRFFLLKFSVLANNVIDHVIVGIFISSI